jgi:uncharacterized protein (DUF427 family)
MSRQARIIPGPGQESVWDYPRPPRLEDSPKHIQVIFNSVMIAETRRAMRVLETSHPPVYYIAPGDVRMEYFTSTPRSTFCEYKGAASYYTIRVGERTAEDASWCYPRPFAAYASLANYIAIYPSRMDACFVDGEQIQPQSGDFYGGWITKDIVGPFKGDPSLNTVGW